MVELVDTLASGASALRGVKVQVLFSAPFLDFKDFKLPPGITPAKGFSLFVQEEPLNYKASVSAVHVTY